MSSSIFFLLLVVIAAIAITKMSHNKMKKMTEGSFHIKDGILVTHEKKPVEIPIANITGVAIRPYGFFLVDKKEEMIIQYGNGQTASIILEYAIEKEIAHLKEALEKHGNTAPIINK